MLCDCVWVCVYVGDVVDVVECGLDLYYTCHPSVIYIIQSFYGALLIIFLQQTVEQIGTAAGNALQGSVTSAVRDILVPGFDRACQSMTHQIQNTFQTGTQQCKHPW